MMIARLLFALTLLAVASPALALSCLPYGPVDAYLDADVSQDSYIAVLGTLTFDESKLPQVDWERQEDTPEHTYFTARFSGHYLGGGGFVNPFERMIDVDVQCFGPWCGLLASGAEYLAFLKQVGGGYLLSTEPCGGMAFGYPDESSIRQVVRCGRGGRCVPSTR